MIDWELHSELLLAGAGLLGLVMGQLLTYVAHQLLISLEHQWQQEAREVLGLGKEVTCPPPKHCSHDTSRSRDWVVQINILPWTVSLALLSAVLASMRYLQIPKSFRPTVVPFGPHLSIAGWASLALKPTILHMM